MSTKTEALPIVAWHVRDINWRDPERRSHRLYFERVAESAPVRKCDGFKEDALTYLAQATARISELEAEVERLLEKAQAVVDRWDTPLWKDVPHTAEFINALRAAIDQARQAQKGGA